MTISYQFAHCRQAVQFLLNIGQMFLQVVFRTFLQQQLLSEHTENATMQPEFGFYYFFYLQSWYQCILKSLTTVHISSCQEVFRHSGNL